MPEENPVIKVEAWSTKNRGIKSSENVWFNFYDKATREEKDAIDEKLKELNKGDQIRLTKPDAYGNGYSDFEITEKSKEGDEMTRLPDLLAKAHEEHEKFLQIETELLSGDPENERWLFKATVSTGSGTFQGHGDATPKNVTDTVRNSLPRMAESRAIARALRWTLGEGKTAKEEVENND